ncbi:hypothetical protein IEQ34_010557 [Dendrobium chrysotoxum]|uniref:Uncharacterized protein n=1 Tax=Dendrobium chrysotoxum TaxID=161865 RepID=A0AAV7GVT6_DENCH|nr:hypothetical protein IEQ34_010557 [Dendrobium chrysotoxum]
MRLIDIPTLSLPSSNLSRSLPRAAPGAEALVFLPFSRVCKGPRPNSSRLRRPGLASSALAEPDLSSVDPLT